MTVGDVVPAVVVTAPKTGAARVQLGAYHADLARDGYTWTRRASAADLFKPGDLIEVAIVKLDEATKVATVTLDQTPNIEGALLAIENRTGQIKRCWVAGASAAASSTARPGVPAAGIDVQADRLHGRDRSGLHADLDSAGCAGQLLGR